MKASRQLTDARLALLGIGAVTLIVLALTESHGQLPAALAAYAGGWWVLGLEQKAPASEEQP